MIWWNVARAVGLNRFNCKTQNVIIKMLVLSINKMQGNTGRGTWSVDVDKSVDCIWLLLNSKIISILFLLEYLAILFYQKYQKCLKYFNTFSGTKIWKNDSQRYQRWFRFQKRDVDHQQITHSLAPSPALRNCCGGVISYHVERSFMVLRINYDG